MRIRELLKLLTVYILLFIAGSLLYIFGMRSGILDGISVFFYRGIAAIILAGIFIAGVMMTLKSTKMKKTITVRDILLLFCAFCCVHIVVFTHLPVTADRSVSVFMLGYMDQKGSQCTKQELEDIFVEKYVKEYEAFDKRLYEQIYTGTIERLADDGYVITESGRKIVGIYDIVTRWYELDDKLVHP